MTRGVRRGDGCRTRCSTRSRTHGGHRWSWPARPTHATSGTSRCSSSATTPTSTRSRAALDGFGRSAPVRLGGRRARSRTVRPGAVLWLGVSGEGADTAGAVWPTRSPTHRAALGYERGSAPFRPAPHARAFKSRTDCASAIAAIGDARRRTRVGRSTRSTVFESEPPARRRAVYAARRDDRALAAAYGASTEHGVAAGRPGAPRRGRRCRRDLPGVDDGDGGHASSSAFAGARVRRHRGQRASGSPSSRSRCVPASGRDGEGTASGGSTRRVPSHPRSRVGFATGRAEVGDRRPVGRGIGAGPHERRRPYARRACGAGGRRSPPERDALSTNQPTSAVKMKS